MRLHFIPIFFFTLVCASGCSRESNPPADSVVGDTLQATSLIQLPQGYSLDTIIYYDSSLFNDVFIVVPVSVNDVEDEIVQKEIKSRLSRFESEIDTNEAALYSSGNSFAAYISSICIRGNLISYCYVIDIYRSGAAHGMCVYESFNYNMNEKKLITFDDFFRLESHEDTALLLTEIKSDIRSRNMSLEALYQLDFCLLDDSIAFNFDDYEIASYSEGTSQAIVSRTKIGKLIREKYR